MEPKHVFVYGTLKRGYGNNRLLTNHGAEFVAEGVTHGILRDGGFPVVEMASRGQVRGEVWTLPTPECLRALDGLEGVGVGFYDRVVQDVTTDIGEILRCYVYVGAMDAQWWRERTVIASGIWKR